MTSFKNSNLAQAWLVLVLATVFGTALAGIQAKLGPVIEDNKIKETQAKIPGLVLGEDGAAGLAAQNQSLKVKSRVIEVKKGGTTKFYTVYDAWMPDGNLAGHVVKAAGQGYADKIELLVGLNANGDKITGLFILDQKETPGLGAKILDDPWRAQFTDASTGQNLTVVKGGGTGQANEIDAISGATISSRSVTGIVNTAVADVKPRLGEDPAGSPRAANETTGKDKERS